MFKPITTNAQITYVSSADPAVDWDAIIAAEVDSSKELRDSTEPWEQKRDKAENLFIARLVEASSKDPSAWVDLLKFKQGEQPTKFVIGVIPPSEMNRITDECRVGRENEMTSQARWRAFLACVRDIQNMGQTPPKRTIDGVEYVDPPWLEKNFGRGLRPVALGVGYVGWRWNQLREDEIKN